ncbi:trigger factor [Candidatus Phytoplasma luffae]|uniref:Trigger factor n=1 Tax=Loofah witches'-broom phytoplasma TaxID=35773 RepID=A0A975ILT9_LOWBP|nr:trigger factor [Candidatus Phytoplasma luffae]QTX02678.1 trigger factor [Candidatus Phytoplasma luffae]
MQIEKINNDCIRYNFNINIKEFDLFVKKAFEKIKHKVEVKGFRKGFVTRDVFEKNFDKKPLYKESFELLVQDKLKCIFENKNYNIIGSPKIVNFVFEDLINKKDFFNFGLEFVLKPKITLCDYKKIKVNVKLEEVKEKEIENKLDLLLKENPILENKKENENVLELGDFAVFDFEGYLNGELFKGGTAIDYTLEIGSNNFIDGFEKQMIGMKVNEKKEINVRFPDNYLNKQLASKEVIFKIFLKNIKIKKNVVWNDELVKNLKFPDINNLEEFKIKIKKELESQKKYEKEEKEKELILDFLIKNSNLNVPSSLIEEEVEHAKRDFEKELNSKNINLEQYLESNNWNKEQFEQNIKDKTLINVKLNFLLDEIAFIEKIKFSPEELELHYQKIKNEFKIDVDKLKQNSFFVENIETNLLRQKVMEFLFKTNIIH